MTAADGQQAQRMTTPNLPEGSSAFSQDWMTAREAAAYLKVKHRTVCRWAKQGKIPAHPLSGSVRRTWRFSRRELDAMRYGSRKSA
jgi:excisionase family DNA binding protein